MCAGAQVSLSGKKDDDYYAVMLVKKKGLIEVGSIKGYTDK